MDLLHVFSMPFSSVAISSVEDRENFLQKKTTEAQTKMDEMLSKYPTKRVANEEVLYGSLPATEIAEEATRGNYDLVIMGMKGEHEKAEKWLGSVTTNLMMNSPCPVLAIPAGAQYRPVRKIAFATKIPVATNMPMEQIEGFAKDLQAELEYVSVDNLVRRAKPYKVGTEQETYRELRYSVVTNPSIVEGLNDYVQANETDILGLYIPKRRLWERLFHFSTSKSMVFHTSIPLLVFQK